MQILAILAASLFLSACAQPMDGAGDARGGSRQVGTILDPYCMPDGSVVRVQYPNSQGSFEGAKASRDNCPWNQ